MGELLNYYEPKNWPLFSPNRHDLIQQRAGFRERPLSHAFKRMTDDVLPLRRPAFARGHDQNFSAPINDAAIASPRNAGKRELTGALQPASSVSRPIGT